FVKVHASPRGVEESPDAEATGSGAAARGPAIVADRAGPGKTRPAGHAVPILAPGYRSGETTLAASHCDRRRGRRQRTAPRIAFLHAVPAARGDDAGAGAVRAGRRHARPAAPRTAGPDRRPLLPGHGGVAVRVRPPRRPSRCDAG